MIDESGAGRRLELPCEVVEDAGAIELVSAWYSKNRVKIMRRSGTGLDENLGIWGEILAAVAENAALCIQNALRIPPSETLAKIKESLDRHWVGKSVDEGLWYNGGHCLARKK
jgi:hypothetical protein